MEEKIEIYTFSVDSQYNDKLAIDFYRSHEVNVIIKWLSEQPFYFRQVKRVAIEAVKSLFWLKNRAVFHTTSFGKKK